MIVATAKPGKSLEEIKKIILNEISILNEEPFLHGNLNDQKM